MPARRDINHYLLHFRLERDDDTASAEIKRRSGVIVKAFEIAPTNSQAPINFLIDRMAAIIGPDKPDADVIRGVGEQLKILGRNNHPTALLGLIEVA